MSDYQSGYQAYFNDQLFDETRPTQWQQGWSDAENDDLYGANFDAYDNFGD